MTDQAPELLPDIVERLRNKSFAGTWEDRDQAADEIERLRALTRPTPAERPVPQVREATNEHTGCICQGQHRRGYCTEPGCPYRNPDALTARPSDAAVGSDDLVRRLQTWPFESGNLVNIETSFSLINEAIAEIKRLRVLPPDEPVRVATIEECAKVSVKLMGLGGRSDDYLHGFQDGCNAKADAIRALEPARITPSTVGGEALDRAKAIVEEAWRQTCLGAGEFDDYAVQLIAAALSPTIASEKECGKAEIELLRNRLAKAQAALRDIGKDGPIWRAQRIAREALVPPAASLNAKETP